MQWRISNRADPQAVALADRHYSRQKIGSPQFVPPGRCLVLLNENATALWVTSWPFAEYVKHAWAGAWVCSLFRNESTVLSSALIREAVAVTRWYKANPVWQGGELKNRAWLCDDEPALGFVTFVKPGEIRSINPGACYKKAGWKHVGETVEGLPALQLLPHKMDDAAAPIGIELEVQAELWAA